MKSSLLLMLLDLKILFFNDTATTEIYTLSLHDALPILDSMLVLTGSHGAADLLRAGPEERPTHLGHDLRALLEPPLIATADRKSTRLNSSHANISYAVFCLKKNL